MIDSLLWGHTGVFGYSWVGILHVLLGLSFRRTLLLANLSSMAWLGVYYFMLDSPEQKSAASKSLSRTTSDALQPALAADGHVLAPGAPREALPEDPALPLLNLNGKPRQTLTWPLGLCLKAVGSL